MVKKSYLTFALLSLFVLNVLPTLVRADFSIQSQLETNTVCPSSTIIINEIVSTTQDASFSSSISGSAAQFTTMVPQGFFLSQGQTQTIFLYITPSSKTVPGAYDLALKVTSQGTTKIVNHQIVVENCHKTTLLVTPVSQTSCTCEQKQITVNIQNQGKYLENYNLAITGPLAQYITLSESTFSMPPGSSRDAIAYVKTPCNVIGNYDIGFKVTADSKYARAETSSSLGLTACYDYSLDFEKTFYDLCETQKQVIPITIKNLGTTENTYDIKLGSPSWMAVDQKSLKISPGQSKSFNLDVQPAVNTQGNYTAYLEITSEKGNVIKTAEINFNIGSCYGSIVNIEKKEDKICNTLNNVYQVSIKNIGKLSTGFDLVLEGPDWAKLDKSHADIATGNQTTATLTILPNQDTKAATYSITIKAIDSISKKESNDTITITTLTAQNCYEPSISSEKDSIEVPQDTAATLLFTIQNKGIQEADYVIETSGTASSFSQINPAALTLESGKSNSLYLYLAPSIDVPVGNYTLNVAARLKDTTLVAKKTIYVSVTKGESIVIVPSNNTNNKNQTQLKPQSKFWSNLWASIVGFFKSIFTSSTTPIKSNETQIIKNSPPKLIKNIPNIEMYSGGKATINLSEYFTDADKDPLEFITVKPLNMTVLIRGPLITLTADENFQGIRDVTFYATDEKKMVASNTINVTVIQNVTQTPAQNNQVINQTQNQTKENQTNNTIECNNYYWFDSINNSNCSYKQFCGAYMYLGLRTFKTLAECQDNLPKQENTSNQTQIIENNTQENQTQINQTQTNQSCTNVSCSLNETKPVANTSTENTSASTSTSTSKVSFWETYKSYILLAILIAIIIILVISGLGKKILKFFEEEPEKK